MLLGAWRGMDHVRVLSLLTPSAVQEIGKRRGRSAVEERG